MHDTAAAFGAAFFRCYADAINGARILDFGAADLNGSLRGCAPVGSQYTGIDLAAGPGVDLVLNDPYNLPFGTASFDVVVSSSCLEHDPMFWLSFTEMCRVLRTGGFIYLNVPSNGYFHRFPTDNWRFYPDAGLALAAWGRHNGHELHLVESFIGRRRHDVWNDCIMVFGKGMTPRPLHLLTEVFSGSFNIRVGEEGTISNFRAPTEDMTLRAWLAEKLAGSSVPNGDDTRSSSIEALIVALAEREAALGAGDRAASERSAAAEAQLTALRDEIAERDAAVAAGEAKAGAAEARLAEALAAGEAKAGATEARLAEAVAEIEAQGRRIAENETALAEALQRAEELGGRLQSVQAELTDSQGARRDAERLAGQRASAAEAKDTEMVSLRADLANRALEVQELRDVAAGSRAEAAAQRAAFVRARQEAAERDTVIERARQEAAESDTAIETMRGEIEKMHDEITSLSEALASTRQIGTTIVQLYNNLRFVFKKKPIMLADRARDAGEWVVAAHYYQIALGRNSNRPEIWIQYGHVLKEAHRLSLAEQAYRQAIAGAPTLAEPYRYLGDVLSAQRKRDDAVTAYRQAQLLDRTSPHALSGLRKLGWSEKDLAALEDISDRTN